MSDYPAIPTPDFPTCTREGHQWTGKRGGGDTGRGTHIYVFQEPPDPNTRGVPWQLVTANTLTEPKNRLSSQIACPVNGWHNSCHLNWNKPDHLKQDRKITPPVLHYLPLVQRLICITQDWQSGTFSMETLSEVPIASLYPQTAQEVPKNIGNLWKLNAQKSKNKCIHTDNQYREKRKKKTVNAYVVIRNTIPRK